MLRFLFPRLTPAPERGQALFAAITTEAREPHWYVEGQVPDTLDGRFRVLTTVAALAVVRLEQSGAEGEAASVALTERFIQVMEAEHREIGLGDPKLGRTVRNLVGSLARRVGLWRDCVENRAQWDGAAKDSVYVGEVSPEALDHTGKALRTLWRRLEEADLAAIIEGHVT